MKNTPDEPIKYKDFAEKFDDSTIHTWYRITITSENGQRVTFNEVPAWSATDIYDQLREVFEDASESEDDE